MGLQVADPRTRVKLGGPTWEYVRGIGVPTNDILTRIYMYIYIYIVIGGTGGPILEHTIIY